MTEKEARQILLENRPERPHSTKHRRLQVAIDVALVALDKSIAETEMMETMLNELAEQEGYANEKDKNG